MLGPTDPPHLGLPLNMSPPTFSVLNIISPSTLRYKLAFSQSRITSYLFDGTGYALINNIERRGKFGVVTRFDIAVRTVANNGVLFLMVNAVSLQRNTSFVKCRSTVTLCLTPD